MDRKAKGSGLSANGLAVFFAVNPAISIRSAAAFPLLHQAITRNGPSWGEIAIKGAAAERETKPRERATEDARDTRSKPATRIKLAPIRSGRADQASTV
jgi:hypothetical protein